MTMNPPKLSPTAGEVIDAVFELCWEHGNTCSAADVAQELDMTTGTARTYMRRLYRAGLIDRAKRGHYQPIS